MIERILSELGKDGIIFIIGGVIIIYIIRFWLIKIYRRVRQIALIMEHFLRKDRSKK